jgi:hypothetical protein
MKIYTGILAAGLLSLLPLSAQEPAQEPAQTTATSSNEALETALAEQKQKAEAGDIAATQAVYTRYAVEGLTEQAQHWADLYEQQLTAQAEGGDTKAMMLLATAYLKGRDESKNDDLAMYKYFDGELRRIDRELADQRVFNATTGATVSCLTGQVNGMQALLNSISKTVIPNSAICPGWGDVAVTITPASTTTTGA